MKIKDAGIENNGEWGCLACIDMKGQSQEVIFKLKLKG